MTVVSIVVLLLVLPASLRSAFYLYLGSRGLFLDSYEGTHYNKDVTQGGSSVPAQRS